MPKKHDFSFRERLLFSAENTPIYHEIKKGGHVLEVVPSLRGQVVVSGGAANGTPLGENPGNVVQRIQLDAVSKGVYPQGTLKNTYPRSIFRRRQIDRGRAQGDLSLGAAGLTGAAGTFVFNCPFPLRFALPKNARPIETSLNTEAYDGLQLAILLGGRDTQFLGNDRVFNWAGAYFDIVDRREAMSMDVAVLYETDHIVPINQPNIALPINAELPKGQGYLDLLLVAETTNQALSDAIINRATLYDGTQMFSDLFKDAIKSNQLEYITDTAESLTGVHYLPIAQDGLLLGVVRDVSAVLDVNKPGTDRIIVSTRRVVLPQEFMPKAA